ncbi:LacI family DNA-binding transcriptional regulator [Phytoactinopolyspora mesophila]|uniref:LacI family DNA-binding transcriptional regulator n=1 Tax=Phytoactinopolyspora mesophila TaxID=2650750 RepID=A0A7K3M8F4_9ACTN|nr:LacI family DNA-binding transcriptional regulator [Phytoactinopolyspora mesophila]NDL59242.1 LacI family DNA-binding transcriptional regulator [Phytoactinopolyspora mesophila]
MTPARRRRPTQVDIARRAGVSQATVSLVISGGAASEHVAESTRQAVLGAAAELGYSANAAARSLKGGRNHLLGLYTFEPVFPVDQRDFYFPFLLGVEEETAAQGYDLLLFSSAGSGGDRRIYARGANRLKVADGCVLLGRHLHREDLAHLVQEDFPFVFIGRREVPGAELSYVAVDYTAATRDIVTTLIGLGHRKMLYLQVTDGEEPTRDRAAGYRQGLAEAGIPIDESLIHLVHDPDDITPAMLQRWVASGITALLVEPTEDDATITAVETAASRAGLRVPGDCSVALLGDPALVHASGRDWTRFTLPRTHMGRQAVRVLLDLLDDQTGQPRQISLPATFVPGDTIAQPPPVGSGRSA